MTQSVSNHIFKPDLKKKRIIHSVSSAFKDCIPAAQGKK